MPARSSSPLVNSPSLRARTLVASLVAAVLVLAGAGAVSTASPAAPSAPAASRVKVKDAYVAVTAEGTLRSLRLVDNRNGAVVRTLATQRMSGWEEPFRAVDLAPDGTVWASVLDSSLPQYFNYRLRQYTSTGMRSVLPYVTSVQMSPDGSKLAVTMLEPDLNRDGKATSALRLVTPSGRTIKTLASTTFPVDKQGLPMVEIGALAVRGWLDPNTLIVTDGCCDSGVVSLVSATTPTSMPRWPTFEGDGNTMALGTNAARTEVLVTRSRESGDGIKVPITRVGIDFYWISKAKPAGRLATTVKGADLDVNDLITPILLQTKATPVIYAPNWFRYRGPGRVISAFR